MYKILAVFAIIGISLCVVVRSDDSVAQALANEIRENQVAADKLVVSINNFLAQKQNVTDNEVMSALKDAAGDLWNSGDNLSLSLIKLAEFLGVQPPPPPQEEDHDLFPAPSSG